MRLSPNARVTVAHEGARDATPARLGPRMAVIVFVLALAYVAIAGTLALALLRRPERPITRPSDAWPDVDVVLPARNEAARLPAALDALAAQDYPGRYRVWVVDDRSDDATPEIVRRSAAADARFALVKVTSPSRRMAPKVHAVARGVAAGSAEWVATTDADCVHPPGWLRAMVGTARPSDVLIAGYVETARPGAARGLLEHVEALDWASLMLTNRALLRLGLSVASSANNQLYRRDAFERAGGFGVSGRAPSGDEDLLAQRLGALPGATVAFADAPEARVWTAGTGTWSAFLQQRRRWVSRYHHPQHYRPGFLAGIVLLGVHSTTLASATLSAPWWSHGQGWLLAAWAVVLGVVVPGMHVGLARLGRRDLQGWPVVAWAVLHPFFIATVSVWSFLRPGSWRAGAAGYRRRWWRAWWWRARKRGAWPGTR